MSIKECKITTYTYVTIMRVTPILWIFVMSFLTKDILCLNDDEITLNARNPTQTKEFPLVLKYSREDTISLDLNFSNILNGDSALYLLFVKGFWNFDMSSVKVNNTSYTFTIQPLTPARFKLYAILTTAGRLCSSQLVIDGTRIERSAVLANSSAVTQAIRDSIEIYFENICHPVPTQTYKLLEGERHEFKCTAPTNMELPYLYYRWYYIFANNTIPIGTYNWQNSASLTLDAEQTDHDAIVQCRVTFDLNNEIVLRNYKITMYLQTPPESNYHETIRYGENQVIKFDCRKHIPGRSFSWKLVEIYPNTTMRTHTSLLISEPYRKSVTNTKLMCLYFVGDKTSYKSIRRIIMKTTIMLYDEQITSSFFFGLAHGDILKVCLTASSAALFITFIILVVIIWKYRNRKTSPRQRLVGLEMTGIHNRFRRTKINAIQIHYDPILEPMTDNTASATNVVSIEHNVEVDNSNTFQYETVPISLETKIAGYSKPVGDNHQPIPKRNYNQSNKPFAYVTPDSFKTFGTPNTVNPYYNCASSTPQPLINDMDPHLKSDTLNNMEFKDKHE